MRSGISEGPPTHRTVNAAPISIHGRDAGDAENFCQQLNHQDNATTGADPHANFVVENFESQLAQLERIAVVEGDPEAATVIADIRNVVLRADTRSVQREMLRILREELAM
ncbi:hypothetical protein [Bradyrhizobium sp. STM 3562]|uniref:hypothetical protein n=1 Tax=Bradyrhizobium sp. STM 3562 TaxID=578924 RepID=UPI00388F1359